MARGERALRRGVRRLARRPRVHRRRRRDARRHGVLRRRADRARHRAAARGAARREPRDQPAALRDARREQGGALRARGARTRAGRLRPAPRARRRSRRCCRRGRPTSPASPAPRPSRRAARSASRCSARWRTRTCRPTPTRRARSRRFARARPRNATLLIDTYDTERAAHTVVALARRLAAEGLAIQGVRIDSGDLAALAVRVRAILDAGGFPRHHDLRERQPRRVPAARPGRAGAPIDGFGVGTRVNTSADAPYLDCALQAAGVRRACRVASARRRKATWPGRKQVYRRIDADGRWQGDVVTLVDDRVEGTPLLAAGDASAAGSWRRCPRSRNRARDCSGNSAGCPPL